MSDIELIKCISNLMTKRSEIIESINNDLKEEIKLLRKENDVLRRLYNLKAGEEYGLRLPENRPDQVIL